MFRRDAKKLGRIELRQYTLGQKEILKSYTNMVRQKAWLYWKKLPTTTKVWISPEDIIEDGLQWAVTIGYDKWDSKRKANFGTFLWHGLEHYFNDKYLKHFAAENRCDFLREKIAEKRSKCIGDNFKIVGSRLVSIDSVTYNFEKHWKQNIDDIEVVFKIKTEQPDFLTNCYAADSLIKLYQECSDELKAALVRWFVRPPEERREREDVRRYFKRLAGDRFIENSREFRELAQSYRLDIEDCRHILRSPECLDKVSRELLWLPYDMNRPVFSEVYKPQLPIFRRDV